MKTIGIAARQECGRWLNNRAENSHQLFRGREGATAKFRDMKILQKFTAVHASIHNHFNQDRHLNQREMCGRLPVGGAKNWCSYRIGRLDQSCHRHGTARDVRGEARPLRVNSGRQAQPPPTSAMRRKADVIQHGDSVPLVARSGRSMRHLSIRFKGRNRSISVVRVMPVPWPVKSLRAPLEPTAGMLYVEGSLGTSPELLRQ
jgi:hypothetical protein